MFYLRTCTGFWERPTESQSEEGMDDTQTHILLHLPDHERGLVNHQIEAHELHILQNGP